MLNHSKATLEKDKIMEPPAVAVTGLLSVTGCRGGTVVWSGTWFIGRLRQERMVLSMRLRRRLMRSLAASVSDLVAGPGPGE